MKHYVKIIYSNGGTSFETNHKPELKERIAACLNGNRQYLLLDESLNCDQEVIIPRKVLQKCIIEIKEII